MRVELVRNLMAHGDTREGKWRGNWRMEWVASILTPPPNVVYPTLLKLMRTPRLPAVDWTDALTDLNGLVRFGEIRNVVSARVPSRSARAIPLMLCGQSSSGTWKLLELLFQYLKRRNFNCNINIVSNVLKCREKHEVYTKMLLNCSNTNTDSPLWSSRLKLEK